VLRMTVRALIALVHCTRRFILQSPTREDACATEALQRDSIIRLRHSFVIRHSGFVIATAPSMSTSKSKIKNAQRLTQTPLQG
jgi:hypothetical protein